MIEETQHPDIADQYDYYYVPTFYVDGVKVHEAGIFKNEMEALLDVYKRQEFTPSDPETTLPDEDPLRVAVR